MPDNAILHEQKAQVLLEVGDAWRALTAATSKLSFFWMNDLMGYAIGNAVNWEIKNSRVVRQP
jgi:hypothetical protein